MGFGDYDDYLAERARREVALQQGITPGLVISGESPDGPRAPVTVTQPAAVPQPAAMPQPEPEPVSTPIPEPEPEPVSVAEEPEPTPEPEIEIAATNTGTEADTGADNPDISDEQNFEAVSSRESIESDRERLARNRELYVVIEPTELPRRPGTNVPNIVAYALATTNRVGQPLYQRGPFTNANVTARNCARFVAPDLAQEAFLASGGPKRDKRRLDPDGDGFACSWDPASFRNIRN